MLKWISKITDGPIIPAVLTGIFVVLLVLDRKREADLKTIVERQDKFIASYLPNTDFGDYISDTVYLKNATLVDVLNCCEKRGLFHWSMTNKAFYKYASNVMNVSLSFKKMDILTILKIVLDSQHIHSTLTKSNLPTQLFIYTPEEQSDQPFRFK